MGVTISLTTEQRRDAMRVASGIVLDEPRPEQAVALARSMVASGSVSAVVLELAGMSIDPKRTRMADIGPLILSVFLEFGVPLPSRLEAGWIIVEAIAEEILAGSIAPVVGANHLWSYAEICGNPEELWEMLEIEEAGTEQFLG